MKRSRPTYDWDRSNFGNLAVLITVGMARLYIHFSSWTIHICSISRTSIMLKYLASYIDWRHVGFFRRLCIGSATNRDQIWLCNYSGTHGTCEICIVNGMLHAVQLRIRIDFVMS